jgi:predicted TIM-barrel fold metal-dependent hydrolase
MKIFDAHSHYMPPQVAEKTAFFKVNWSNIEKHLEMMDQSNIEMSLLLYPTSDAHIQMGGWTKLCDIYNPCISEIVKKYKGRFIGGGILPVDNSAIIIKELKRIEELGLTALSLASSYDGKYLDDEIFFPVYEFAQSKNIPIHVHAQILNPIGEDRVKDPLLSPVLEYVFDVSICLGKLMMSGVFLKYPNVKFIFAHYGGVLPLVRERFDTTYQMLRGRNFVKDLTKLPSEYFKNLYFDMSGSKSLASLQCALEVVDSSRILFGSDYPANQNIEGVLKAMEGSELNSELIKNLFYNNFAKIFTSTVKV